MTVWMLQSKWRERGLSKENDDRRPRFWTGQDYTRELDKSLRFTSQADADRWLRAHGHLHFSLQVVEVTIPEPKEQQ